MEILDNKIKDIDFVASPNTGGPFGEGLPDTIIIHYTAGSSAESSIRTLTDPNAKASAHLVVGRDGQVTQLVPFNIKAWHAGRSQYGGRVGFNNYAIGIEIDNAGLLEKRGDRYYAWFNRAYPESDVIQAVHRNQSTPAYWHAYTEEQVAKVFDICRLLIAQYPITSILGHEEISPGRKIDPGPAFPLDKLRDRLLGGGRDEDTAEEMEDTEGVVATKRLNIRSGPSTAGEKVARPLIKGQKVKILEAKEGWLKVSTAITGWVSARYVQRKI